MSDNSVEVDIDLETALSDFRVARRRLNNANEALRLADIARINADAAAHSASSAFYEAQKLFLQTAAKEGK